MTNAGKPLEQIYKEAVENLIKDSKRRVVVNSAIASDAPPDVKWGLILQTHNAEVQAKQSSYMLYATVAMVVAVFIQAGVSLWIQI